MENGLNGSVQKFDPSTGTAAGTFATLDPSYFVFSGMAAGNGYVYLTESGSAGNRVFKYSESGSVLGSFSLASNTVEDLAVGSNGNLFVMQQFSNSPFEGFITEYDPATGAALPFTWVGGMNARSMALAPNGNIALGDQLGLGIYTAGDALLREVSMPTPAGLYFNPTGDAYATNGSTLYRCIGCQTGTSGLVAQILGTDPGSGTLSGVIVSPDGSEILVTSLFAGTILKFNASTGNYDGVLAGTGPGTGLRRLALIGEAQAAAPEPGSWALAAAAAIAGFCLQRRRVTAKPAVSHR
jgi:DNA-binding beta-propeller fold protein YncE